MVPLKLITVGSTWISFFFLFHLLSARAPRFYYTSKKEACIRSIEGQSSEQVDCIGPVSTSANQSREEVPLCPLVITFKLPGCSGVGHWPPEQRRFHLLGGCECSPEGPEQERTGCHHHFWSVHQIPAQQLSGGAGIRGNELERSPQGGHSEDRSSEVGLQGHVTRCPTMTSI